MSDENPPSQVGAILIGTLMMVAGIGIFALGIAGREGLVAGVIGFSRRAGEKP